MNRAITSLAILKVNSAELQMDYLDSFIPFIVNLLKMKDYREINPSEICEDFNKFYGLNIPRHPMILLLNRTRKKGFITKLFGKYIPIRTKLMESNFAEITREQETKHKKLLIEFIEYCGNFKHEISEELAEAVFISFLKDHDLDILFASQYDNLTLFDEEISKESSVVEKYLLYKFIKHACDKSQEIFDFIVDFAIGHMLASTLLYDDFSKSYTGSIDGMNIYFDIATIFDLSGINGEGAKIAIKELLNLLNNEGANLYVFEHTRTEYLESIESSRRWINRHDLDLSRASRALLFFYDNFMKPEDIDYYLVMIDKWLEDSNIKVIPIPLHPSDYPYNIDEQMLFDMIVDKYVETDPEYDSSEKERTIYRDVKSISAVFRNRADIKPQVLNKVKHIFITANTTLAYVAKRFEDYITIGQTFSIPTVLTDIFLGTMMWIQAPNKIEEINKQKLISNCFAALQPSPSMIRKYIAEIEELYKSGEIDEEIYIILKSLSAARSLLQDKTLSNLQNYHPGTAREIYQELRKEITSIEAAKYEKEREKFLEISTERDKLSENYFEAKHRAEERVTKISKILSTSIFLLILLFSVLIFFAPYLASIEDNNILTWILRVFAILIAIANFCFGINVLSIKNRLQVRIKSYLFKTVYG